MGGVAGCYALTPTTQIGLELLGEDLEGLWEREEAEGGARLLAGPSFGAELGGGFRLRLNTGATLLVAPHPTLGASDARRATQAGFLGRIVLGYEF